MSGPIPDLLYQAASVWYELTKYVYHFTYGYKKKLCRINLMFSVEEFPHLAGFQYLKDISLPRYNPEKIILSILDGKITQKQIEKGAQYGEMVLPRLEALIRIKDMLETECFLFKYKAGMYPFYTQIKADYLISYHSDITSFVFIIQSSTRDSAKCNYLCCSAFKQGERNFEINQRRCTLLKKERLDVSAGETVTLYDKTR